jgi:Na+/H+ antiporter NhaC
LGFVGLAIGANQSYLKVNNITNAQLNDTITAGVTLLVRMQTMFYIIIASITFLIILFKIFDKLKQSQEELDKTYDNWGKK